MRFKVIINGQPTRVAVHVRRRVQDLIDTARLKTGNIGNVEWEARNAAGAYLEPEAIIQLTGLKPDSTVYINQRAGIGGDGLRRMPELKTTKPDFNPPGQGGLTL